MTKIAHFADLHIGNSHLNYRAEDGRNQRLVDFERAALAAGKQALQESPDLAIIAGDFLDETNLMPGALSGAVKFIDLFAQAGVPLIVIGGNHDVPEATGRYNALTFLAQHHGIDLYLQQGQLDIAGLRLHFVPYRVISRAQRGRAELQPFNFSTAGPNVLVTHGYAPGVGVPEIPEEQETVIPPEWLDDPRFSLVLLGHIHHRGEIADNVFYSGSTERRNFGESDESPGFYIHQLGADGQISSTAYALADSHSDLPRPMLSYDLDAQGLSAEAIDQQISDWISDAPAGALLRVVLDNVPETISAERRQAWARQHIEQGGLHFETSVRTRQVSELLTVEFKKPPKDIGQGFQEYIQKQEVTADRQQLLDLAAEVSSEARDLVIAQQEDS